MTLPKLTETQVRALFAIASAVISYLLVQTAVAPTPAVVVLLGAVNAALAAINPSDHAAAPTQ